MLFATTNFSAEFLATGKLSDISTARVGEIRYRYRSPMFVTYDLLLYYLGYSSHTAAVFGRSLKTFLISEY